MEPISNNTRKMVASLARAKGRREMGLFVAEGTKCVLETINAFKVLSLYATPAWIESHSAQLPEGIGVIAVKREDIIKMSSLSTPGDIIAVYHIPDTTVPDLTQLSHKLVIALDRVQDPGNLGTIMRIADWFGITDIICSHDTVDLYNPKTVQATMGAIARVTVHYTDLPDTLGHLAAKGTPVYGTFLDGNNLYDTELTAEGVILMGNEGNGISPETAATVSHRLLIPPFPADRETVESLNVSMATAITVAEFRRRQLTR